eukprot:TRINITY_DN4206_c0_g1_i1.p2 TRINITY_DN4206_c0_g1~~TRINITY_DN4206_c0_g1_i1.p2  ORF type:complete len:1598 (+),score=505.86 TRINITY_DN4206_c0_g1_i1:63-4856(+)
MELHHVFGVEVTKRNNLHYVDSETLLITGGNYVHLINAKDLSTRYVSGWDGGGIGAIAVHPSNKYFAVAEKGQSPNIYIYSFPELELVNTLQKGTERAYCALSFNHDGTTLASVGSYPDFMLTVWAWRDENVVLRSKAFSQDVYRVRFSPLFDGQLITSGTGHIRFWKMAHTFTGLKLQGMIGKFGQVELSDVAAFVEFPTGLVLSGTETGNMLLWDGNIIKVEISRKGGKPCHKGAIEVLDFNLTTGQLISAGDDGYIRMWDYTVLEGAEPSDDAPIFEIEPLNEIRVGDNVRIRDLLKQEDHWMVQDASGGVWRLDLPSYKPTQLIQCHSGSVSAVSCNPGSQIAATTGLDGSVRIVDYVNKKLLTSAHFRAGGTTLLWLPLDLDKTGRTLLAGFNDGVVRVLQRCTDGFKLVRVFKPHSSKVNMLAVSTQERMLATCGEDGDIFFIDLTADYQPLGYVQAGSPVKSVAYSTDGRKLLACTQAGRVIEYESPRSHVFDTSTTFLIELPSRDFVVQTGDEPSEQVNAKLAAVYLTNDQFLLSIDGPEAGKLYQCQFGVAKPSLVWEGVAAPCTSLRLSSTSKLVLAGFANGVVRIYQSDNPGVFYDASSHDGLNGRIRDVATSSDDSFVLSAGNDGVVLVQTVAANQPPHVRSDYDRQVGSLEEAGTANVDDITSDTFYSLEQEKQKAEQDRMLALAESKKKDVRTEVLEMRREFEQLLACNSAVHSDEQLPRAEFDIDPEFRAILEKEASERIEISRKELEWISAKKKLILDKLKGAMLDPIAVERIVLLPFQAGHYVSSFRTAYLSPELKRSIEQVHAFLNKAEEVATENTDEMSEQPAGSVEDGQQVTADEEDNGDGATQAPTEASGKTPSRKGGPQDKVELRKAQRAARQKLWDELNLRKPPEDYELPDDVQAINWAEKNMGDYKLKSSESYVVPEHMRINAEKKRREMVLLEESVFAIKMDFNERLLALRDLKTRIIENVKKHNEKIVEINSDLQLDDPLFEPSLQPIEIPDARDRMDRDMLLNYEKQVAREARRAAKATRKQQSGGFGGFGGGSQQQEDEASDSDEDASAANAESALKARTTAAGRAAADRAARLAAVRPSALEEDERAAKRERLLYERAALLDKIKQTTRMFDDTLEELRVEKFKLEGDLKSTDLKLLLLHQELVLLKEFEKKDVELTKQLDKRRVEKAEVVSKIAEVQEKIVKAKNELAEIVDIDNKLMQEFNGLVPANHQFRQQLLNSYRAKIKRKKVRETEGSEDEGSDIESDDDESDFDSDSENEREPDVAPPGHEALYKKVCDLREKRLDVDDKFKAIQTTVELLKKDHGARIKDEQRIDKALSDIDFEIQAHQQLKQKRLNELDVVLALRLHQLQAVEQGTLPDNMQTILVFANSGLSRLRSRILELDQERDDLLVRRKKLAQDSWKLDQTLKDWDAKIAELRARVVDVQMLKFGQVIELEKLDSMTVNKAAEELKADLGSVDRKRDIGLEMWDRKIQDAREQLSYVTKDNTERLQKLGDLTDVNYRLESALNATQGKLVAEVGIGAAKRDQEDRERLMQLVQLQASQIEAIRAEISVLSHKGGHVYTPAERA